MKAVSYTLPSALQLDALSPCCVKWRKGNSVRFKFTWETGLVITLPIGFNLNDLPPVLFQRQKWLQKINAMQRSPQGMARQSVDLASIDKISFIAVPHTWTIWQQPVISAKSVSIKPFDETRLIMRGALADQSLVAGALRRWMAKEAEIRLTPAFMQYASQNGFGHIAPPRWQTMKSRWGSCSSRQAIALNAKLLFLPMPLVESIFAHELTHTLVMDHSSAFYEAFSRIMPDCMERRAQLIEYWRTVPAWLDRLFPTKQSEI